ncbi:MAG TPA: DUF4148 domain-containing protein [Burkholderiaceae bacterium]|nr:DUF4148 domain-containing protein [Burkholderiaceae bacterium]
MKRFISTALISLTGITALMAAGAASAQSSTEPLTRAQVVAQLQQARASGELARETDELYGSLPPEASHSTLSRAQVHAEVLQAAKQHKLDPVDSDEYYPSDRPI